MFKLFMVLAYTFLKPYISKICNDFSLYIYIYIYREREREREFIIQLNLNSSIFYPIIHLPKKKKKDGHMTENWTPIKNPS